MMVVVLWHVEMQQGGQATGLTVLRRGLWIIVLCATKSMRRSNEPLS